MTLNETNLEAIVCASLLDQPAKVDEVNLSHKDFMDEQYGLIYRTIQWLVQNGKHVTNVTLIDKLRNRVDENHLTNAINTIYAQPWALEQHVHIIREKSARKRMENVGKKLLELSQSTRETDEIMAEIESAFDDIRESAIDSKQELKPLSDLIATHEELVNERIKRAMSDKQTGIHTGFPGLDRMTLGFQPTYLYVIGARPSMGKTALTLQSAIGASKDDYAAIFSIEMDNMTLLDRLTAAAGQIEMSHIMSGTLPSNEFKRYSNALELLRKSNVYVDDNCNVNVQYIRSRVRRLKRKIQKGKRLVVYVDYLQIMKATKGRSRAEEVGNISTELKQLAGELDCAVVALAQLNRSPDSRSDKRPTLADIRESGQVEQDADCIMLLYRDAYYNKPENPDGPDILEVIIAKQRNGRTGTVPIVFKKEFQSFIDTSTFEKEAKP